MFSSEVELMSFGAFSFLVFGVLILVLLGSLLVIDRLRIFVIELVVALVVIVSLCCIGDSPYTDTAVDKFEIVSVDGSYLLWAGKYGSSLKVFVESDDGTGYVTKSLEDYVFVGDVADDDPCYVDVLDRERHWLFIRVKTKAYAVHLHADTTGGRDDRG
jgi:hypothetical protein